MNLALADGVALGCVMRIVVTPSLALGAARQAVEDVLRAIDAACSRFRMDSEIAQINIAPEVEHKVSPLLALALGVALDAARRTDGAVDPTVGGAVRLLGYDRDFDLLPPAGQPIRLRPSRVPGWQSLRFDARRRLIWLPRGVEVDLGATAKALAADLAAEAALAAGSAGVLVSLGGDIAVRGQAPPCGWQIQVCEDSGAPIADGEEAITIAAGGLATSSTTVRRWRRGELELHHIIDPSNGLPAGGRWRTVTVAANSCVAANTASTEAIVRGDGAVTSLRAARLPARLVDREGSIVRLGGWPARALRSA